MEKLKTILQAGELDKKFFYKNLRTWLFIFALVVSMVFLLNGNDFAVQIIPALLFTITLAFFFYLVFFILVIFSEQQLLARVVAIFGCYVLALGTWTGLLYLENSLPPNAEKFIINAFIVFIYFSIVAAAALGYWYYRRNRQREKTNTRLEMQNLDLKANLLQSELNFLRAQINPHFFYNCLNFIYSDVRRTNPKAAEATLLLADLMRYAASGNQAAGGNVLLEEEWAQIHNLLRLHQLRFDEPPAIETILNGNADGIRITSHILLTFAENQLKYADLTDAAHPAIFQCDIGENDDCIRIHIHNNKSKAAPVSQTGIGLKNIKERLNLLWPGRHRLHIEDTAGTYSLTLEMPVIKNNIP